MAEFNADPFNFEKELWESYRRFIERLRNQVAVRYSHNRAVTPLEENPPTRFFNIVLQTNSRNIRLRIRRDNLYMVGYQMQGSDEWLEFRYDDNNPVHRITGSTFLNFGDRYAQILPAAGVENMSDIQVGRRALIDAINSLATSPRDTERAKSLVVVVVMIIESLRFDNITNYFVTECPTCSSIPEWIDNHVHGWGDLSFSLLRADADSSFRLSPNNRFNVFTLDAAVAIIGILKGRFFGPGGHRRLRRAADGGENINEQYAEGRHPTTINNIHGSQSTIGDIYGIVKGQDGLGYEYVYNRESNITAYNDFTIDVTLISKEGLSDDDEISKGQFSWYVTNITTNKYDKLLFQELKGRFSSATVSYAVLSDAVEAMVEVMIIKKKKGDPAADVYGLLTSHNVNLNSESVLFRKADSKFVNVKNGEVIPLSRSVVAVPLCSNFIVRADLKGSNIFSSDDEIAN